MSEDHCFVLVKQFSADDQLGQGDFIVIHDEDIFAAARRYAPVIEAMHGDGCSVWRTYERINENRECYSFDVIDATSRDVVARYTIEPMRIAAGIVVGIVPTACIAE